MQLFDKYISMFKNKVVILVVTPRHNSSESLLSFINKKQNSNIKLIHVVENDSFEVKNETEIQIDFTVENQLNLFKKYLLENNIHPTIVLYNNSNSRLKKSDYAIDKIIKVHFFKIHFLVTLLLTKKENNKLNFLYLYCMSKDLIEVASSSIDAYFQSLLLENNKIKFKIIGLENNQYDTEKLFNEACFHVNNEYHIKYIGSKRYVKQLVTCSISIENRQDDHIDNPLSLKRNDTCILVGGLGGLGYKVAKLISLNSKCHIIILGRKLLNDESKEKIKSLESEGAKVSYYSVDVGDANNLLVTCKEIIKSYGPINGIIFCAGITRDSLSINKKEQYIHQVFKSKINGVINLDNILRDQKLNFFLIFTSLAGVVGNIGQSDYAYANSFLDNYAKYRNIEVAQNLKFGFTQSIAWPYWENGGMHMPESARKFLYDYVGMEPLTDEDGLEAFEHCLKKIKSNEFTFVLKTKNSFDINQRLKFGSEQLQGKKHSMLNEITSQENYSIDNNLKKYASDYLKKIFHQLTKIPSQQIDLNKEYEHYGMDSVMIMDFNSLLSETITDLPSTVLYEYQTINALLDYLLKNYKEELIKLFPKFSLDKKEHLKINHIFYENKNHKKIKNQLNNQTNEIAIIGLNGIYPDAESISNFWENIVRGKSSISMVPSDRWNHNQYFNENKNKLGHTYSKWGGFIKNPYLFDSLFFNISPNEAKIIDPQERLFLEVAWKTLEDAGYAKESLHSDTVGVYVGAMWADYRLEGAQSDYPAGVKRTKTSFSSIANRVSYYFDFNGPSVAFDTMCSSSLTSIYFACEGLASGRIDYALAGGVNLALHPNKYILLSESNFASSDGLCRSFGSGGDGYVPGEGVGAVLLKPLSKAIDDNDNIYAVIKAWEINHGGKVMGYTVPNPKAQADVIHRALKRSAVNPASISYIEAHGTGTNLGDPIEITGLCNAYEEYNLKINSCAIGSVKSNIGHLEGAAGIAGLTKLVLQLKNKKLVPSLHSESLNPNIKFEQTPFYVNQQFTDWIKPSGYANEPRRGGVSAFGAGGSNAHLIVEEWDNDYSQINNEVTLDKDPYVVILSSKSKRQLLEQVKRLKDYLLYNGNKISLKNIAYTLQVGRAEMDSRLAIITTSMKDLFSALDDFVFEKDSRSLFFNDLSGSSPSTNFRDKISKDPSTTFNSIVSDWLSGVKINWDSLYPVKPQKVSLPGFVFDKEYLRIPDQAHPEIIKGCVSSQQKNDLRKNSQDEFSFSYKVSSSNKLIKNHILNGKLIVPGALYLDIVSHHFKNICNFESIIFQNIAFIKSLELNNSIVIEVKFNLTNTKYIFTITDESKDTVCHGVVSGCQKEKCKYNKRSENESIKSTYTLSSKKFYDKFSSVGIEYGNLLQGIGNIQVYGDSAEAVFITGYQDQVSSQGELVNAYLLDCCFQSVSALVTKEIFAIPFMISELEIYGDLRKIERIYSQCQKNNEIFSIYGVDSDNNILLELKKLVIRSCNPQPSLSITSNCFWRPEFKRAETPDKYHYGKSLIVTLHENIEKIFKSIDFSGVKDGQVFIYLSDKKEFIGLINKDDGQKYLDYSSIGNICSFEHVIIFNMVADLGNTFADEIIFDKLFSEIETQFETIKLLISSSGKLNRLIYLTKNVYSVNRYINNPIQGCFDSLFKSISNEYRKIQYNFIDLSSKSIIPWNKIFFNHPQLNNNLGIYENGIYYYKFLNRYELTEHAGEIKSGFKFKGVYLIIGGSSGIGLTLAKYLTNKYEANVIITGTRDEVLISDSLNYINNKQKGTIEYFSVDLLNIELMNKLFQDIYLKHGKINGVIHSANIKNDKLINKLTGNEFVNDISISFKGTYILSSILKKYQLDFYLIFSSAQSLVSDVGLSNYATGSLFKDLYALYLSKNNQLPVKLIDWGYWNETGMMKDDKYKSLMEQKGILPISITEGIQVIEQILINDGVQYVYINATAEGIKNLGWTKYTKNKTNGKKNNLLENGKERESSSSSDEIVNDNESGSTSHVLIKQKIRNYLIEIFSKSLGILASKLSNDKTFDEYGIDSIIITEITNIILDKFTTISSTILFEHNTIGQLSEYLFIYHFAEATKAFHLEEDEVMANSYKPINKKTTLRHTELIDKSYVSFISFFEKEVTEINDIDLSDNEIDEILF